MWPTLVVLVLALYHSASALFCFEGTNCALSACGECEGIACVRVLRPSRESSRNSILGSMKTLISSTTTDEFSGDNVAFTCLPVGTRMYDLEPEGCRVDAMNERMACICYNADFCNSSHMRTLDVSLLMVCIFLYNAMTL